MMEIAILALVVSLIAGGLGFSGVAAAASTVAKAMFGIFLFLALLLFLLVYLGVQLFT